MVSLTLSVPPELKKRMDQFPEMNWSEVARAGIKKRLEMLDEFLEFIKDSDFTKEDAIKLGRKVNAGIAKKHRGLLSQK